MSLFQNFTPEARLMMGAGIMGGQNIGQGVMNGAQMAMPIIAQQKEAQQAKVVENKTRAWLQQQYPGEDFTTMSPDMMKMYASEALKKRFAPPEKPDYKTVGDALYNTQTGEWITPPAGVTTPKLTADQREYDMAKAQGFKGSFMEYQIKMKEAGRQQVNIDTGEKLPSGFRWKNPDQRELGVEPIPGGPATQIPAELAARVGMAETFQKRIPEIKAKIKSGEATGPIDVFRGKTMGTNPVYGDIESGVDALRRLLTGAGMNESEANDYARRYLPTYYDDDKTLAIKIDRLSEELEAAKSKAMLGRGGDQPAQVEDPLGIR